MEDLKSILIEQSTRAFFKFSPLPSFRKPRSYKHGFRSVRSPLIQNRRNNHRWPFPKNGSSNYSKMNLLAAEGTDTMEEFNRSYPLWTLAPDVASWSLRTTAVDINVLE